MSLKQDVKELLFNGTVIPAFPLALNEDRSLDELRQRALVHYYIDAGAGGIAVGVHTTQFEIRDAEFNLYERILKIAVEEINKRKLEKPFIKIAGVCGKVNQALEEAQIAKRLGYDMVLLSMGNLHDLSEFELLERTKAVAQVMPVFGFYLQPSAGGRILSYKFWESFAKIDNVVAIKAAPFNRYQTHDVLRAVCHSPRVDDIAVYTGNDDNIVADLLTEYSISVDGKIVKKQIIGGLLGHWAVWTKSAVELFEKIKIARETGEGYHELLNEGTNHTDANAAFFDVNHNFKGCIAGINEVLARQGLLQGNWCLLDKERLSENQSNEIDRIYESYPELNDDEFVKDNLDKWLEIAKQ